MAKKTTKRKRTKYVLAVAGSPRKQGNSDILCDHVLAGAKQAGARAEKFYLSDMKIKPCIACGWCQTEGKNVCKFSDDMRKLYPKIAKCDVLVIASPIWFFHVSSYAKLFMDKLYPFAGPEGAAALKKKRVVACFTFGDRDPISSGCVNAVRSFQDAFGYLGIPVDFVYASAWEKGEIKDNQEALEQAMAAGKKAVK